MLFRSKTEHPAPNEYWYPNSVVHDLNKKIKTLTEALKTQNQNVVLATQNFDRINGLRNDLIQERDALRAEVATLRESNRSAKNEYVLAHKHIRQAHEERDRLRKELAERTQKHSTDGMFINLAYHKEQLTAERERALSLVEALE